MYIAAASCQHVRPKVSKAKHTDDDDHKQKRVGKGKQSARPALPALCPSRSRLSNLPFFRATVFRRAYEIRVNKQTNDGGVAWRGVGQWGGDKANSRSTRLALPWPLASFYNREQKPSSFESGVSRDRDELC